MALRGLVAALGVLLAAGTSTVGGPAHPGARPAHGASGLAVPATAAKGWAQEVHYTIEAALDEGPGALQGAATLTYGNASPDSLDRLYLHLHLNAFRPNSVWARTERRPEYDFQGLEEPHYAYERLKTVRIGDRAVAPAYPHAPDSTVVELPLPEPLGPGDSASLHLEWEARLATLCRRQCRSGRHYDFAQWYPRIAVYDEGGWQAHPLYPQGEFYGEFATYDVTLEVADDQVIGATGVPLDGDPGWRPGPGSPRRAPLVHADWYEAPSAAARPGLLTGSATPGRKRVRFYAEDVHHFAWSADPEYVYEGGEAPPGAGRETPVAIHVLYRPGDEAWAGGVVVDRTVNALTWLERVFGPYPYPQLTNLHRLEGGGTEFPMVVMNGGPGLGLIVHEAAHQYAHAVLANNEWREAWLDEGMAIFLGRWFFEAEASDEWRRARGAASRIERHGIERPISSPAEEFSNFGWYGYLAYDRPAMVLRMLQGVLGREAFRRALRIYYEANALGHVDEEALREAAEEAAGTSLEWFFEQWLHTTATLDYGLGEVSTAEGPDGRWTTVVEVIRAGEAWMPVTLRVGERRLQLDGRDRRQVVEVVTEARPATVRLDPDAYLLDADPSNDRREL